jgi:hypothetical protein
MLELLFVMLEPIVCEPLAALLPVTKSADDRS